MEEENRFGWAMLDSDSDLKATYRTDLRRVIITDIDDELVLSFQCWQSLKRGIDELFEANE